MAYRYPTGEIPASGEGCALTQATLAHERAALGIKGPWQPKLPTAAELGDAIHLTKAERSQLGIRTIRAHDESPEETAERRKLTERERGRRRRKAKGCHSREAYEAFIAKRHAELAPTVLELRAQGLSQHAIAKELRRRDIPTISGTGIWEHRMVGRILARTELSGGTRQSEISSYPITSDDSVPTQDKHCTGELDGDSASRIPTPLNETAEPQ